MCAYTVDFHWGDYTYSIAGESEIALGELFERLGVTEITLADVADVSFTDPAYIEIEQTDSDWLLRSLAPFSTEEALVLTLTNGETVEIKVTDADGDKTNPNIVTAPAAIENLVYTGEAKILVTAGDADGGTMLYSLTEEGEYTNELPTATDAGEYIVYYKVQGDESHNDYGPVSLSASIAKAPVTVTADAKSKTYGDADPELTATVTGLVGTDPLNYSLSRAEGETVGTYAITVTGDAEQGNYSVSYINGIFTVELRTLRITAASETKVYDGYVLSNDGYTAEGLAAGDTIQAITVEGAQTDVNVSDDPETETTPNNMIRDAHIVNASGADVTGNYDITYVPGTLTVTKKPITITADSAEKEYDGTELKDEGYTSTGLADGDVFESLTVNGSQTLVGESDNVPADVKIVRPMEDDTVVDVNDNYTITYANGVLKVTNRKLTVTADSADKVYDGTALTKKTYTVEGLAEGDSVQSVTVTGTQTIAGTSENKPSEAKIVNADGEDVTACYDITYKNGTLNVTKKSVKLTANSGVQVADGTKKTIDGFTISADDTLLDGVSFTGVSASGSGTTVGSYNVTFTGVTTGETTDTTGNYVVTETVDGTLQIVQSAPLEKSLSFSGNVAEYTITINPNGLTLNGGNSLTLKDTFTGNQSIDYSSVTVNPNAPYDYSGYTGTFTIPDETPVTITYKTRVSGAAGEEATFGNTAELGVTQNGSFASASSPAPRPSTPAV